MFLDFPPRTGLGYCLCLLPVAKAADALLERCKRGLFQRKDCGCVTLLIFCVAGALVTSINWVACRGSVLISFSDLNAWISIIRSCLSSLLLPLPVA